MDLREGRAKLVIVSEKTNTNSWSHIDGVALENDRTMRNTIGRVFGILLCANFLDHTVEADGLTGVLQQVDQFLVTDEVANEDVLAHINLKCSDLTLTLLLNLLEFFHPAERNFPGQKVACLLGIQGLDVFL